MATAMIEVRDIARSFGATQALAGVDVDVPAGSVVGLLGPNGAGKTTLVRILATLLLPDRGTATIDGVDVVRQPARARSYIGLAGQSAAVEFFALIGLVVKNIESVEIASFTPIFPLTFAASTFVPVQGMPGWLQAFAKAQPISQVVNATRTLTQGVRPPTTQAAGRPVLYSLLWIAAITVVFAGLAIRKYQKVE